MPLPALIHTYHYWLGTHRRDYTRFHTVHHYFDNTVAAPHLETLYTMIRQSRNELARLQRVAERNYQLTLRTYPQQLCSIEFLIVCRMRIMNRV